MIVELKQAPCNNCKRNSKDHCRCGIWDQWFLNSWRRVQLAYGVNPVMFAYNPVRK